MVYCPSKNDEYNIYNSGSVSTSFNSFLITFQTVYLSLLALCRKDARILDILPSVINLMLAAYRKSYILQYVITIRDRKTVVVTRNIANFV